jgi:dUTP pyrophosphatase
MEKSDLEDYIKKLQEIEKDMSSDDFEGIGLTEDLNKLLNELNNDITNSFIANSNSLKVKIKKLNPNAVIPSYAKDGDAGLDLVATSIISNTTFDVTYGTGIAMEIPKGYVGLVFPRSSIRKYDLLLTNSVGVIDSGYRGEIQATFKKTNGLDSIKYDVNDRIVQIMIVPYPKIDFIESDELSSTERGDGGFGSTGA